MNPTLLVVLLSGLALVIALALYALHIWRKVWRRREQLENYRKEVTSKLSDDLKILCSSLLDEQMPWIEGCIRLKVILEHYDFELSHDEAYSVFQEVFVATEHIPTHEAWTALSKEERSQHEETFAMLEEQYRNSSFTAARRLLEQLGGRLTASASAAVQDWTPEHQSSGQTLH